jgi:hypothetical protein
MKTLLIILTVVIVTIIIKACTSGNNLAEDNSRSPNANIPTNEKVNDKIIVVSNVNHEDINKVLTEFCNVYNKNDYVATPRLWQLSSNSFAVTFPHDIDFATYCFAVNFLKYPINTKWQAQVRAWATTKANDDWITDKSVNKKVMLFLAVDDKEYDNVFLTTQDNIGYKLGFAAGKTKQLLTAPKEQYIAPILNSDSLANHKHEDFKKEVLDNV